MFFLYYNLLGNIIEILYYFCGGNKIIYTKNKKLKLLLISSKLSYL